MPSDLAVVRVLDQHIGMGRMLIEYANSAAVLKPVDIDDLDVDMAMQAGKVIIRRYNKDYLQKQCSHDTGMNEGKDERVTANFGAASTRSKESSSQVKQSKTSSRKNESRRDEEREFSFGRLPPTAIKRVGVLAPKPRRSKSQKKHADTGPVKNEGPSFSERTHTFKLRPGSELHPQVISSDLATLQTKKRAAPFDRYIWEC